MMKTKDLINRNNGLNDLFEKSNKKTTTTQFLLSHPEFYWQLSLT